MSLQQPRRGSYPVAGRMAAVSRLLALAVVAAALNSVPVGGSVAAGVGGTASGGGPPLRPGPAKPPPGPCAPGQRRIGCASAILNAAPASTPSSFIIDGPFVGNGNLGMAMSADAGLQFWLGANNMWSTNTAPDHGLCDGVASRVNPTHSGSTYTLISAGKLNLQAEPLASKNTTFAAEMNLERGLLQANLSLGAVGLRTESFITADKDALVVRLEAMGAPLTLTVSAEVPQSASKVSGGAPWVLPTEAGHDVGGSIHAARQGVNQITNNLVLNTCGRGGQHAGAQRFALSVNGDLTLKDGRCLVLSGSPAGRDCANTTRKITIGDCANEGASAWVLNRTTGQLLLYSSPSTTYYAGLPAMKPPPPPPPFKPQPGYISVPGAVGGQGGGQFSME